MKILMENPRYVSALSNYLLYNKVAYKLSSTFKNESEYKEYLQLNPPVTILNEQVKSYGEMDIANFLFQNRIKYDTKRNTNLIPERKTLHNIIPISTYPNMMYISNISASIETAKCLMVFRKEWKDSNSSLSGNNSMETTTSCRSSNKND